MATRVFVENLPSDMTEDRLRDIFTQIGAVETVKIQSDLITRRPKGTGYVDMSLDVDAYRAVNIFNGVTLQDKRIHLKEVRPFYERAIDLLRQRVGNLGHGRTDTKQGSGSSH